MRRDFSCQMVEGNQLLQQGFLKDADRCFRKALRLEPGSASAHNGRGLVSLTLHKITTALRSFTIAIRADDCAIYRHNRALAYWELGKCQDAIRDLTKAILLDDRN